MLEWLTRMASHLRGQPPPDVRPPEDPFAGVRHPRRRGPDGRDTAEEVPEPDPDEPVEVIAAPRRR
jgi:hypothetical protein